MTQPQPLSLIRTDPERAICFPAGRFTQPGFLVPFLAAIAGMVCFYAAQQFLIPHDSWWHLSFFRTSGGREVSGAIVFLTLWSGAIMVVKWRKMAAQSEALGRNLIPDDPKFVLSHETVAARIEHLYAVASEPRDYMLYNRILLTLSNFKNMGRIGDVEDVLRSRASSDANASDASYTILKGFIWAVPVLGFIGTVVGLTAAMGQFGAVLKSATNLDTLKPALMGVTAGLSTGFETTMQGLIAALFLQLAMTALRRREEAMLTDFDDYCDEQVIGKLRMHKPERDAPIGKGD